MIRFLLFAMFAAGITAIVVLVKMPMAPGTPLPVAVEAAPATAKPGKTSAKKSAPSVSRSGSASSGRTQVSSGVASPETTAAAGTPADDPANPAALLEQKTTVKDDAALYPSNSVRARAVGVLKRGEPVESDIEILDTGGRWSLVQGTRQNRQGFVRSENLKRNAGQP